MTLFADHASSELAYDHTGLQPLQRRAISGAIGMLPKPEQRALADHIYQGGNVASAARYLGVPVATAERWWLDVQDALGRKLAILKGKYAVGGTR